VRAVLRPDDDDRYWKPGLFPADRPLHLRARAHRVRPQSAHRHPAPSRMFAASIVVVILAAGGRLFAQVFAPPADAGLAAICEVSHVRSGSRSADY